MTLWLALDRSSLPVLLGSLLTVWSLAFAAHVLRYVISASILTFGVGRIRRLRSSRLQDRTADDDQRRMEYRASLKAGAIFALQFLPMVYAIRQGWTRIYFDPGRFGWPYLGMSLLAALLVHDTYFYWTHRWMHRPRVFRWVHLHHHRSQAPTAWAAFSFHPLESMIQGGVHLLLLFLFPLHVSVLTCFIVWATFCSAMIHCGHDAFFVRSSRGLRVHGRLLNTALDHDLHHAGAHGNFALYFSLWDRWMGTRIEQPRG